MIIDRDCYGIIVTFLNPLEWVRWSSEEYIDTLSSSLFSVEEATSRGIFVFRHLRLRNLRKAILAGHHDIASKSAGYFRMRVNKSLTTPIRVIGTLALSPPALINYYSGVPGIGAKEVNIILQLLEENINVCNRLINHHQMMAVIETFLSVEQIMGVINMCGIDRFTISQIINILRRKCGSLTNLHNMYYRGFKITPFRHADVNDILEYLKSGRFLWIYDNLIAAAPRVGDHSFIVDMIELNRATPIIDRVMKLMPIIEFIFNDKNTPVKGSYVMYYMNVYLLPRYHEYHSNEQWFMRIASLVERED
jgi:hypothetical protein